MTAPDLLLRKVTGHPQTNDAYRVVLKSDDGEVDVGSIGKQIVSRQRVFWRWGIDTVLPRQPFATDGEGRDREDCMAQFRAVWEVFASEPERLAEFLKTKKARATPKDDAG